MSTPELLLAFPDYVEQTGRLSEASGIPFMEIDVHHFPDEESKITLPASLPQHVAFCRSLHRPNAKLTELILAAEGARSLGASTVSLVAPYLCYMRQDKAFHPGEVVSQRVIGRFLAQHFENVLTVDAHLHRVKTLDEAVPAAKAINITATRPMAEFLKRHSIQNPLLIGPDAESEQWVAAIASLEALDYIVGTKERRGDRDVYITLPAAEFGNRNIVLVDDVASSGQTLLEAAKQIMPEHPASVSVLVTHALFVGDAMTRLKEAGVDNIWSCDSIPHPTNVVSLAGILSESLQGFVSGK